MKFENTLVMNIEAAIRGMRNPMNSHIKSDSYFDDSGNYIIGQNDLKLAKTLVMAGSEHRKFLRQVFVSVDITAPRYWWTEFDTYKVGTVANSESTMHTLTKHKITKELFEFGDYSNPTPSMKSVVHGGETKVNTDDAWENLICNLEKIREIYIETNDKRYWKELIRLLPQSFLQKRTITMNYEVVRTIYHQRKDHKLTEWSCGFVEWTKNLPYFSDFVE